MNKELIRKLVPHFIAVAIFLIVAVIYCRPVLEGQILNQTDMTQWKGMSKSSFDFKEKHGHFPLWTNSMFSGMPAYQIAMEPDIKVSPGLLYPVLYLGLPKPISFFFLACICFYFLTQSFRINPYVGIIGSLAYAYVTYNIGIIEAGHETKIQTIALLPAFIASLHLLYEKRYIWGLALLSLFTTLLIMMNHMQIVYYAMLIAFFMTIGYLVFWIKRKEFKHAIIAIALAVCGGALGIACNAVAILTTNDAAKTTIRGGSELPGPNSTKNGLSKEYALSYSMFKPEPLVMMVPNMYGGSGEMIEQKLEDSKAVETLQSMPQEIANQIGGLRASYWGGLSTPSQVPPNAPPYAGAIICFLALIGFFILDNKHKWWILGACVISVMMSWGEYFDGFNSFLLHTLPMYNKFRVPSMIIIVPIFLFCVMATLTLQKIVSYPDKNELWEKYKKGLLLTAGVFAVLLIFYFSADFRSQVDKDALKQTAAWPQQGREYLRNFLNALQDDRKSLFMQSFLRSFLFVALAAALLWLAVRKKIQGSIVLGILGVLAFIDIITVDTKYLNSEHYTDKTELEQTYFTPSAVDQLLMQDTSFYRVLDRRQRQGTGGALTAYFHNSVEGYHAAKLSIYQDLVEHQLNKNNLSVLNMLNAKYILFSNERGEDTFNINPQNLGAAWFVNAVRFENTPQAVMNALTTLDAKDTAIVFSKDKSLVTYSPGADSSDFIQLVSNNNDEVLYKLKSSGNRFAVFSEVFYDLGWKAYIDDKETPIIRTNYVLRGLSVPPGQHTVRFVFHPSSFYTGEKVSTFSGWIILLLLIGALVFEIRRPRAEPAKKTEVNRKK